MFTTIKIAIISACIFGAAGIAMCPSSLALDFSADPVETSHKADVEKLISEEEAKRIALDLADVKEEDTTYLAVHLNDNIYKVEFIVGGDEYDYDIEAHTGKILSMTFNVEENKVKAGIEGISIDEAKEIAIQNAGFAIHEVIFTEAYHTYDDGYNTIKIKFKYGEKEFEYEIDSATGTILHTDNLFDD